ncbi:uncharacterized protein (TIGR02646 family) [Rhodobacter viridis]|uniref:Uncharacterized protein (TIGR02646 family) n=1 Tax=Rhodobacter viridis TaxID=1054202 RepID=A0A318U273_9RHOB|nr:endonuclease [Rhodobacter viridis]PYF10278.1 uncharacterized protein (TIGR02646 family) [Rhodobacter viridis]
MRHVERTGPVPQAMDGPQSRAAAERAKAAAHVKAQRDAIARGEPRGKGFDYKVYKDEGVRAALERLFHGKCAYCESDYAAQAPVDIEHYRPKSEVEDAPEHLGYWWLAMEWTNLLPSCIDCNRRRYQLLPNPTSGALADLARSATTALAVGKETAFPVFAGSRAFGTSDDPAAETALERPYLLDPCRDDPAAHLTFLVDAPEPLGLVLPARTEPGEGLVLPLVGAAITPDAVAPHVSARGAVSIQVYGLNRLGLVQARTRILRHLEMLGALVIEAHALAEDLAQSRDAQARTGARIVADFADRLTAAIAAMAAPDQPYSAMVGQWIDRWTDRLGHMTEETHVTDD